MRRLTLAAAVAGLLPLSLPNVSRADVGGSIAPVVYGVDDRVDYYDMTSPTFQDIARNAIVMLVQSGDINLNAIGLSYPPFSSGVPTLGEYLQTLTGAPACANTRFVDQPTPGYCSGTLIDDDLVLTAGHCITNASECHGMSVVFDAYLTSPTTLAAIDASDIYTCQTLLVRRESQSPHIDYAVFKLDRPVVGRVPAQVRTAAVALPVGTPVNVLGFGSGLPLKFDDGGSIQNAHGATLDTFVADTDTFAGNSGSGVFDDAGTLIGVLVSGATDYTASSGCADVNVLTSAEADEESTYVFNAIDTLCAGGLPAAVCPANGVPGCGDGFCSGAEDAGTCSSDCTGDVCPDGVCGATEDRTSCPYDCTSGPLRRPKGGCEVERSTDSGLPLGATAAIALVAMRSRRRKKTRGARP